MYERKSLPSFPKNILLDDFDLVVPNCANHGDVSVGSSPKDQQVIGARRSCSSILELNHPALWIESGVR